MIQEFTVANSYNLIPLMLMYKLLRYYAKKRWARFKNIANSYKVIPLMLMYTLLRYYAKNRWARYPC